MIAQNKPGGKGVRWVAGDATFLPPAEADLVTMTGNVAQAITEPEAWERTLRAVYDGLKPQGYLVFETRDPGFQAGRSGHGIVPTNGWKSKESAESRGGSS